MHTHAAIALQYVPRVETGRIAPPSRRQAFFVILNQTSDQGLPCGRPPVHHFCSYILLQHPLGKFAQNNRNTIRRLRRISGAQNLKNTLTASILMYLRHQTLRSRNSGTIISWLPPLFLRAHDSAALISKRGLAMEIDHCRL
jgi:hypothetical protein